MTAPLTRPRTWGECVTLGLGTEYRVCPHVSCVHHLAHAQPSCVLRVAAMDGLTRIELARLTGATTGALKMAEHSALRKIRNAEERAE